MKVSQLPLPRLEVRKLDALHIVSDNALARTLGVRVAFTGRAGGVSTGDFAGLNLGSHVGDDAAAVEQNRSLLLRALGAEGMQLVVPNQVHGVNTVVIDSAGSDALSCAREQAAQGADALVVDTPDVAALLCFADCAPVIVVSPTGAFAVVHAGWRGAVASIASSAVRILARRDCEGEDPSFRSMEEAAATYNAYIGPHIRVECFETGVDVTERFVKAFGAACSPDERHVDLSVALRIDLERAGLAPERIADAGVCTVCGVDTYYSYRAEGGVCGRHGAIAFRKAR